MKARKCGIGILILTLAALSHNAHAVPVGQLQIEETETFSIGDDVATIDCKVYWASDEYIYTYQITNGSSVPISFFSVSIVPGATVHEVGFDGGVDLVSPLNWSTVGAPAQSVDALFNDTIDNDGLSSALLWFRADHGSAAGSGVLFGTSGGIPSYSTGVLPAPIPEPATVILLGAGGALVGATRKRRFI
ncbi:MAG: PEP-CTERM sorting domain-containing protein [Planctomycetota bacterium]|jgi:hypothetical protein